MLELIVAFWFAVMVPAEEVSMLPTVSVLLERT